MFDFLVKAPALVSLEKIMEPKPDHVRACLLELIRILGTQRQTVEELGGVVQKEIMKTKVVVEQGFHDSDKYTVIKLVNRVVPEIGHVLKREELQKLMAESVGLTVEVIPHKREKLRH